GRDDPRARATRAEVAQVALDALGQGLIGGGTRGGALAFELAHARLELGEPARCHEIDMRADGPLRQRLAAIALAHECAAHETPQPVRRALSCHSRAASPALPPARPRAARRPR